MPDEDSTKEKQAKADEEAKKEGKESADPVEPVTKSEGREAWDWRVQNDNKPLWTRSPKDVSALPAALTNHSCMSPGWKNSRLLRCPRQSGLQTQRCAACAACQAGGWQEMLQIVV